MPKHKNKRKACILHASADAVRILEAHGYRCVLEPMLSAVVYGSSSVPDNARIVVPTTESEVNSTTTLNSIQQLLVGTPGGAFRARSNPSCATILYTDPAIDDNASHRQCTLHISTIDQATPGYSPTEAQIERGLPLVSRFAVMAEVAQKYLKSYDNRRSSGVEESKIWKKEHLKALRTILKFRRGKQVASIDNQAYRVTVLLAFKRLSTLLPDLQDLLQPYIVACGDAATGSEDISTDVTEAGNPLPCNSVVEIAGREQTDGVEVDHRTLHAVNPATANVLRAATKVIKLLKTLGIPCALFGSTACYLYGSTRTPNDIDILTFPPQGTSAEGVKQALYKEGGRRHYMLAKSRARFATHKILYARNIPNFPQDKLKVDILVPGTLSLPRLEANQIVFLQPLGFSLYQLPVVPFPVLLLQKLQGWDDHRRIRSDPRTFARTTVDVEDLEALFALDQHMAALTDSKVWEDESLFDKEFQDASIQRALDFTIVYSERRTDFVRIGLFQEVTYF